MVGGGEGGNDVMGASLQRHEKLMQRRRMDGALALLENVIDERYCLVLCDEISDHFPLIDETLRQLEFCNSVISHIYSEIRQKLSNSACKDATPLPSGPFSLHWHVDQSQQSRNSGSTPAKVQSSLQSVYLTVCTKRENVLQYSLVTNLPHCNKGMICSKNRVSY